MTTQTTDAADLARAHAFERANRVAAADRVVEHPYGVQVTNLAAPHAYMANMLHADAPLDPRPDPDAFVAALDDLQSDVAHRHAFVCDPAAGSRLAPALRERGWIVEHDVFMALRRPRDRDPVPGLARETNAATLAAVERAVSREQPYGRDETVVAQLSRARAALCAAPGATRYFVGGVDGADGASATLYSDGRVAQVEDVGTLAPMRKRGLARAVVSAAADAARATGHELVFLVADVEDWPRELYTKLGFDPIGYGWRFTRLPAKG